ncbi:hypothetical protein [Geobacter sp. FeAm09]|uniref:hypothetical protein n=1 Tax=Geobacter sp. FeAm09 TaxID=2597769 RepID=UPI00143CE105|nr:hypothetical protein [Geobacter sp. FeAm09]
MVTTSEIAVTATIWALTAAGGFFGIRAALRRRREQRSGMVAGKTMRQRACKR